MGIKIFINIKNGSPNAKTSKLNEVFNTSKFVNSPLKKIVVTICSAQKYIPIHEGKPISSTIFCDFLTLATKSFLLFSKSIFESNGRSTVPIAIANTPIGN